jgi:hypothetical protein
MKKCGTAQPHDPAACGRGRATGQHAMQGRRRVAAAIGGVPLLLQFLLAPHEFTQAAITARAYQRDPLGQAMAALHAGHGSGLDRSRVEPSRSAPLSGTAVATATSAVRAWVR